MAYVHLPFMEMEHENLGASIGDLENLTNLGHGELRLEDLPEDAGTLEAYECPATYPLTIHRLLSHIQDRLVALGPGRCPQVQCCVKLPLSFAQCIMCRHCQTGRVAA